MSAGPVALVDLGECANLALRAKTVSLAVTGAGLFHLVADYATPALLAIKAFGLTNTGVYYRSMMTLELIATSASFWTDGIAGRHRLLFLFT